MTTWSPKKVRATGPRYLAIADLLAKDIEAGRLQPGEKLPTHRALAKELGVNVVTVTRAYTEAARRGLVEGEVGRGTFVSTPNGVSDVFHPLDPDEGDLIDFHFNTPVGDVGKLDAAKAFRDFAAHPGKVPLTNGYVPAGLPEHRAAGAAWIRRSGLPSDPERVMVVGGAQHGMTLVMGALADPGDVVLTEEVTYPGMKALARFLHLRPHGLAMDHFGILPDDFETACRKWNPKFLYTMPTIHNPTGRVLAVERRQEIAEIARTFGVAIVEDDTYGFLHPEPPPALATFAPERTWFLTSLSKSVANGLRIGFVQVPDAGAHSPALLERLAANVAAVAWAVSPITAELAARWIRSKNADAVVASKRKEVAARRRAFERMFQNWPTESHPASSHLWLPLPAPWRAEEFAAQARREHVAVTPAEAFMVGRNGDSHTVRVCLGTPFERKTVERGLGVLGRILEGAPQCCSPLV